MGKPKQQMYHCNSKQELHRSPILTHTAAPVAVADVDFSNPEAYPLAEGPGDSEQSAVDQAKCALIAVPGVSTAQQLSYTDRQGSLRTACYITNNAATPEQPLPLVVSQHFTVNIPTTAAVVS